MESIGYNSTDFYPTGVYNAVNNLLHSQTSVHRFNNGAPIVVELVENHTTGKVLEIINLKDFLAQNPQYEVVPGKERTIYITFKLGLGAQVVIYPVHWTQIPVTPAP